MNKDSKIYIAGHRGMVGSAIFRKLTAEGYTNIITKTSAELDLRNQQAVADFFAKEKPNYVFLAAAKVGGIVANNTYRAEFIYDNLMMESNIIHQSYVNAVKKLLFLGSSCIYPKMAPQPLKEEYLLSGYLEETNKSYAIAKIAGIKLCESYREEYGCNYISAMPANLYGPNDNYDLEKGHVLAALMRKFITAKKNNDPSVTIWGTGTPKREFLHVDDLAEACLFLMQHYNEKGLVNIGTGIDVTILELAELIRKITGYEGSTVLDESKPDGAPRKLLDVQKINNLGWQSKIKLYDGLNKVYIDIKNLF
ncbi:GDP-L-fucose synthase [Sediminibacterium sp.]|uniref:GDP-L-fucose synthase family protein n=1 Tax=Sediminibacterium sp. TaxID=1917865 RepID=UPI0027366F86|nr:GDP-L-fucose synthase [Sediminibacterium sp.]MDP3392402.1 GDP-L-fucose synthase [Sediminibacterium sp.]MDP3565668.1 GDP-L-fucose synthase [Sediminibacterium sp.]